MKIVLDTNVIVSGLLNPYGSSGKIIRMVASGLLELCYDSRILSEYRSVLFRPKFHFNQAHVDSLLDQIKSCGHVVAAKPLRIRLPDPYDEPFLEVALQEKAKCLVTGNLRHYPTKRLCNITVLSPSDFLKLYLHLK
jgi:putative PIN family toxin of toxin-antitoxin system